jgi:hypothetical protein
MQAMAFIVRATAVAGVTGLMIWTLILLDK